MTKALETAIEKLRALPDDRQEAAAALIEALVAGEPEPYPLTAEQEAVVRAALARADRGAFADPAAVEAVFRKHGA